MSSKIKLLEQNIANQIAAGEVAERPTLIIKELVENAIDAGSDSIRIFLKNSGFDEMHIIDNGEGIPKEDISTAFLRHATSKLTAIEDLDSLYTMGFRGEALASIAAVARVFITTKTAEQDIGYKGISEGGEFLDLQPAPCNDGTEIMVTDLFYNTPARKKFLATPARELRDISDMVGRIIIAHPHIAIELRNNNKKIFLSPGKGDMRPAIMSVYGRDIIKKLVPLISEKFEGYISHPGYNKPSRNFYHFYINNRYIQSDALNRSLEQAYHTLLPNHRFPVAFININLDPSEYDINVHPNKLDVKFNKEAHIEESLREAINTALISTERAYNQEGAVVNRVASPQNDIDDVINNHDEAASPNRELKPNPNHAVKPDKFTDIKENQKISLNEIKGFSSNALNELMYLDAEEEEENLAKKEAKSTQNKITEAFKQVDNDSSIDDVLQKTLFGNKKNLKLNTNFDEFTNKQKLDLDSGFYSSLTILGQFAASFIVAAEEDALYLIDQHAAHERLLYNKIKKSVKDDEVSRQPLLIPMELNTNYRQYSWVIENIIILRDLGFVLEEFGDNSFIIREIPLWAQDIDIASFLTEFADGCLKQNDILTVERILESKIMMKACKSAIKANKYLGKSDIHYLFTELDMADDAFTCPHGRPIAIKYGVDEIRRKFLRS